MKKVIIVLAATLALVLVALSACTAETSTDQPEKSETTNSYISERAEEGLMRNEYYQALAEAQSNILKAFADSSNWEQFAQQRQIISYEDEPLVEKPALDWGNFYEVNKQILFYTANWEEPAAVVTFLEEHCATYSESLNRIIVLLPRAISNTDQLADDTLRAKCRALLGTQPDESAATADEQAELLIEFVKFVELQQTQ